MTAWMKRAGGCGCAAVLAVILVVAVVAWGVSQVSPNGVTRKLDPVSAKIPPALPEPVELVDIHAPGRTADLLTTWSQPIAQESGISGQALRAYANAELIAAQAWPQCHLRWNTLAAIGHVETRHGTYNGNWFKPSKLDATGRPQPPITGIALNGLNGTAKIVDTDGGVVDGDTEHDRAVGPMQFIPQSWNRFGGDANGDGAADPQQIDDAALGSAALLCSGQRDLNDPEDWTNAVLSYNASMDYVRRVALAANSYAVPQPAAS